MAKDSVWMYYAFTLLPYVYVNMSCRESLYIQ